MQFAFFQNNLDVHAQSINRYQNYADFFNLMRKKDLNPKFLK
jgi:hypothetical protein